MCSGPAGGRGRAIVRQPFEKFPARRRRPFALPRRVPREPLGGVGSWSSSSSRESCWFLFVTLFTPRIDYRVSAPLRPDSDEFLHVVEATCQAAIHWAQRRGDPDQRHPVLSGDARRDRRGRGIRQPRGVHLPARRSRRHADRRDGRTRTRRRRSPARARCHRQRQYERRTRAPAARRPAASSASISRSTWYRLHRLNNRTHRELLIVDGTRRVHRRSRHRGLVVQARRRSAGVARHDGPHRRSDRHRAAGCLRRELAGMRRRDPDVCRATGHALDPRARPRRMLVKSSPSDRATVLARGVPDADRRRGIGHRHQHAVFPARPGAAALAGPRRAPRCAGARHRARASHRSAARPSGQPPDVRRTARQAASGSSSTGRR